VTYPHSHLTLAKRVQ